MCGIDPPIPPSSDAYGRAAYLCSLTIVGQFYNLQISCHNNYITGNWKSLNHSRLITSDSGLSHSQHRKARPSAGQILAKY